MKNRETDEWLTQNIKSTRNFIRKWGHFVKHDDYLKPIIPSKYNIGIIIKNCTQQLLAGLEPWCSNIFVDISNELVKGYINFEQQNTTFNLSNRVQSILVEPKNDILVEIDGNTITQQDYEMIEKLSEIIQDSGEKGEFELGNLKITINSLKTYEKDLIICQTS